MTSLNDKALKDFVKASRVNDSKAGGRVYSVGPYGNRVAFAYQQARAFALAAGFGLSEDSGLGARPIKVERDDISIAILGGGIAGITLMAALHSLGFTRLKLFERKSNVLMDQAYASHRFIHPGYNSWPFADEHASTTRFPFLNWFAGPCDKVIAAMRQEWQTDWVGRFAPNSIELACVVQDVTYEESEKKVSVSFSRHGNSKLQKHYCDFAFAAFGYGSEKSTLLSEQTSGRYWHMDTIQPAVNDHEKQRLLCVGDGDGALIDCARLAYGVDVFDVANELMGSLSSDAGRPHNVFDWKRKKSAIETKICDAEALAANSSEPTDKITGDLQKFYVELLQKLSGEQLAILNRGIIEKQGFFANREVHLVGRNAAPFQPSTAPINKLILANLISKNLVIYHKGELKSSRLQKRTTLKTDDYCPKFSDFDYRVIRIGSEPPIEKFFGSFKEDHKTLLVRAIGDFNPGLIDPELFLGAFDLDGRDRRTPGSVKNLEMKKAHIAKFLEAYFRDSSGRSVGEPQYDSKNGRGIIVIPKHENFKYAARRLGGYDWHVFGIPLVSGDVNKSSQTVEFGPGFSVER